MQPVPQREADKAMKRLRQAIDDQDRLEAEGTIFCGAPLHGPPRPPAIRRSSSAFDEDAPMGSSYGSEGRGRPPESA